MAATGSLQDPFNQASVKAAIWSVFGAVTWTGILNAPSSPGTTNYSGVVTVGPTFDLTGSYAYCELVNAGNQSILSWQAQPIVINKDASNDVAFYVESSILTAQKQVATVFSTIKATDTYNPSIHKYLRIRESAGTTFFDYSADRIQWTNYTSLLNPFPISSVTCKVTAGYYTVQSASTVAKFDNFNIVTPAMLELLGTGI